MRRKNRVWVVTMLPALLSCSESNAPEPASIMRIATGDATYARGDRVDVSFENISGDRVYINRCYGVLEQRRAWGWAAVMAASGDEACNDYEEALEPGDTASNSFPLPVTLLQSTYRYRFTAITDTASALLREQERLSNTFSVQ